MLKDLTVKEVNVCFVDKWSHSISLINVQPEENCRICWTALLLRCGGSCVQSNSKNVKCWCPKKKLAWTDLDKVSSKKRFFKESNIKIEKSTWTDLGKVKRASSVASVFKISSRLVTRGLPKRFALRWPDLDKRCSRCYTLRGCVFADVQSHEELKMLLQAKRQPG
jgi:hypothetical protein